MAGSTGYLGSFIVRELLKGNYETRTIVRNKKKLPESAFENSHLEILEGELTNPKSIENCSLNVDTVTFVIKHPASRMTGGIPST